MTRQVIMKTNATDVAKCRGDDPRFPQPCQFYTNSGLFELCIAGDSQYVADGRQDYHTVHHMRGCGTCGEAARLYIRSKETAAA